MANERIFISYKRKNDKQVYSLVEKIENELGVKCWVDIDGIESMAQFASKICRAIDQCDVFMFMHSSEHLGINYGRDWTIRELSYADNKQKHIVLVKLDDAPLDNYFLLMFGALNYTDSRNAGQWSRLMDNLRGRLGIAGGIRQPRLETQQASVKRDKVFKIDGLEFRMKYVEGGSFMMGATPEQGSDAFSFEKPVHQVTLNDYYIGETQVTQALWRAVMGSNPSNFKGDDNPVEMVSWLDCQEFLKRLSQRSGYNFRLPTEAEWEYAARGGSKSKGYKYAGSDNIDEVAWYEGNSGSETHSVRGKKPNELGLYDMSGNVDEWCNDWYGGYSANSQTNPTGPVSGSFRVLRGSGWFGYAEYCRVSFRCNFTPSNRFSDLGFRLALSR